MSQVYKIMHKLFIIIILTFYSSLLLAQKNIMYPFPDYENDKWVDSVFNSLSIDEKIGQLIMLKVSSAKGIDQISQVETMVEDYNIGGIITLQGGPVQHVNMVNRLQKVSKIPLLVAIDATHGLSMPLDSCIKSPDIFTIAAVGNDSLIFDLGADRGKQCKRLGIQINFIPHSFCNFNTLNPVIGFRSDGNNPQRVCQSVAQYTLGLESNHVFAALKDLHGNENGHKTPQDLSVDEYGFEELVEHDIKNKESITYTDAINCEEVKALIESNCLPVFVMNPAKTIMEVKKAILDGTITVNAINLKCRKILMLKRWAGLNHNVPIRTEHLYNDLNQSAYRMTLRNIAEQSLTVIQNVDQLLPLRRLDTLKIATLSIGRGNVTDFQRSLERYTVTDHFFISKDANNEAIIKIMVQLKKYNLVIAEVDNLDDIESKNQITGTQQQVVQKVAANCKSVFVLFGNPYVLNYLEGIRKANGLIVAYQESTESQDLAGQLLFGAFGALGKLPVNVNGNYRSGDGMITLTTDRFKYTLPEELGIDSAYLKTRIDSLVNIGLKDKAFPGCAIFLARNGKVIFKESYGYQTYSSARPLHQDDLFDFASLTKIIATVPALMKLYDQKKFFVNQRMSDYWPDWKGSNKQGIIIADVLSHQARLKPGIPFWMNTVDSNGNFKPGFYAKDSTDQYGLRVSKYLYLKNSFRDSVYAAIRKSALLKRKQYVYSDLGFIIFPGIIEKIAHKGYESYLKDNFYHPLGAYSLTYRPYLYQPIEKIDPTEYDRSFRKEQLQGFVHDESAAVLGGISGNAGLFGTINDAAKVMQMYLNYGLYGGDRYLSEATMKEWTRRHFEKLDNRRGYGFDKPYPGNSSRKIEDAYPAPMCSDASFGHSGFTGTFAWADPKTGILFLFFSNRVYPTRTNNLISRLNLRESIQQTAYQILLKGKSGW